MIARLAGRVASVLVLVVTVAAISGCSSDTPTGPETSADTFCYIIGGQIHCP